MIYSLVMYRPQKCVNRSCRWGLAQQSLIFHRNFKTRNDIAKFVAVQMINDKYRPHKTKLVDTVHLFYYYLIEDNGKKTRTCILNLREDPKVIAYYTRMNEIYKKLWYEYAELNKTYCLYHVPYNHSVNSSLFCMDNEFSYKMHRQITSGVHTMTSLLRRLKSMCAPFELVHVNELYKFTQVSHDPYYFTADNGKIITYNYQMHVAMLMNQYVVNMPLLHELEERDNEHIKPAYINTEGSFML